MINQKVEYEKCRGFGVLAGVSRREVISFYL